MLNPKNKSTVAGLIFMALALSNYTQAQTSTFKPVETFDVAVEELLSAGKLQSQTLAEECGVISITNGIVIAKQMNGRSQDVTPTDLRAKILANVAQRGFDLNKSGLDLNTLWEVADQSFREENVSATVSGIGSVALFEANGHIVPTPNHQSVIFDRLSSGNDSTLRYIAFFGFGAPGVFRHVVEVKSVKKINEGTLAVSILDPRGISGDVEFQIQRKMVDGNQQINLTFDNKKDFPGIMTLSMFGMIEVELK